MRICFALVVSFACSSDKPPEQQPAVRATPVDPIATIGPRLDAELTRTLGVVKTLALASSEPCTDQKVGRVGTVTLDGLEALATNRPLPPSAGLSSLAVIQTLKQYRAGTLKPETAGHIVEDVQKLRRVGVYDIKTFRDWGDKVEGQFEARLVFIEVHNQKTLCHITLSIKKQFDPDDLGIDEKPKTFTSYIRDQVNSRLLDFE